MEKKFPFKSTLLSDLRVLKPKEVPKVNNYATIVVCLAQQLSQLDLNNKLDELRTVALDLQMAELPTTADVDEFRASVHTITSVDSGQPYDSLLVLVRALLALPASNADSEWGFSMVDDCYNFNPSSDLLEMNKTTVRNFHEQVGLHNTGDGERGE